MKLNSIEWILITVICVVVNSCNYDLATSSMRRLRGRRADVQKEINEIVESLATEV